MKPARHTSSPPRKYPARDDNNLQALFAALRSHPGFEGLHAQAAQWLMIPDSLAGLWQIVGNLPPILQIARDSDAAIAGHVDLIGEWAAAAASIPAPSPFRKIKLLSKVNVGKRRKTGEPYRSPPCEGIYETHPVWPVWWFASGTSLVAPAGHARADAFSRLQALLLCCHIRVSSGLAVLSEPRRLREAAYLLRSIHQPSHAPHLDRCAALADIADFYDLFESRHDDPDEELRQEYGAFADLLNDAYALGNDSVFLERQGDPHRPIRQLRDRGYARPGLIYSDHSLFWVRASADRRPAEGDLKAPVSQYAGPGERAREEIRAAGAHPAEFQSLVERAFDIDDFRDKDPQGNPLQTLPPLKTLYVAARNRNRAEIMRAQRFTTRVGRPQAPTLAKVFMALEACRVMANAGDGSANTGLLRETVLLAAACLVTGATAEEMVTLQPFDDAESLTEGWRIAFSPRRRVWLRPYAPPERNALGEKEAANVIEVRPRIALSDVFSVGAALGIPRGDQWFNHPLSDYEHVFAATIEPVLIQSGVKKNWSSLDGLADMLPEWFDGLEEGDALRSSAIFARETPLAEVQAHYVAFDRAKLDGYFRSTMARCWNAMLPCGFRPSGRLFVLDETPRVGRSMAGSDRSPKPERVRALVTGLAEKIEQSDDATPFDRHNLIAAYIGICMAVALGFRDIRTPVLDLELIDSKTGFMPLQEKDRPDGHHCRLVWVPPRLCTMVDAYLQYLRGLWTLLPTDASRFLRVPATKARDRRYFGAEQFTLDLRRTLFLFERVGKSWKPREYTGAGLERIIDAHLPGHWSLPNFGRHLAATALFNADGAFASMTNAMLGHWEIGESPWAPTSSFDPRRYREQIAPVIEQMLDSIGFRPVRLP